LLFCVAVASFLLDRALRLPRAHRAALLVVWGAVVLHQVLRELVLPLARRFPEEQLALEVERRSRVPRDLLSSALELGGARAARQGFSPQLTRQVVARAEAASQAIMPRALVDWSGVKRSLILGAICLSVSAIAVAAWPGTALLWARRNLLFARVEWPRKTHLELVGFAQAGRVVPKGEDVRITVRARGVVPRIARLKVRFEPERRSHAVVMNRVGPDTFQAQISALHRSCTFTVEAGDGVLGPHRLTVVERPRIARAEIRLSPPAYLGMAPRELAWNAPALSVPRGSEVRFALTATRPLSQARVTVGENPPAALDIVGPDTAVFSAAVDEDVRYEFQVRDRAGLEMSEPLALVLHAVPDREPEVALAGEGIGEWVTADARLPLLVNVKDDHAAARAWLECNYPGGVRQVVPRLEGQRRKSLSVRAVIDLADRGLAPGDTITCVALAQDACTVPAPNTGRSQPLAFRVVTAQDLLASLLVRQQDVRQDLEQQIDRQRETVRRLGSPGWGVASHTVAGPALAAEERAAAQVVESRAEEYRRILLEMLNNRLLTSARFGRHLAGIVDTLQQIASPAGCMQRAAELLSARDDPAAAQEARALLEEAVDGLETVRFRMLLLETYAQVIVAVEEIAEREQRLLEQTRVRYERMLKETLGEE